MMRALFTGVSGLRVHQTKMDVIGNNIANVNTLGFKSSRATFEEVFSQKISGASAANEAANRGGINPLQVGLGVNLASIDRKMTQGAAQRTDNPLDAMIQGDGFFVVGDTSGQYLTRAGNFKFDASGNLNLNGMKVYGWDAKLNEATKEYEIDKKAVTPITIKEENEYMEPEPTTQVNFSGNLQTSVDGLKGVERDMTFYDSLGNDYSLPVVFKYDKEGMEPPGPRSDWSYSIKRDNTGNTVAYMNGDRKKPVQLNFSATQGDTTNWEPLGWISFNTKGTMMGLGVGEGALMPPAGAPEARTQVELFVNVLEGSPLTPNATIGKGGTGSIVLDFTGLTQFENEVTSAKPTTVDGNIPGRLQDISFDNTGRLVGRYSNSQTKPIGQIALAEVKNPAGLESIGDGLFAATSNSGTFDGVGIQGNIITGALEMSNVDLGSEFTEMITTQRGYQANSKTITTADDMLQEAVQLKR